MTSPPLRRHRRQVRLQLWRMAGRRTSSAKASNAERAAASGEAAALPKGRQIGPDYDAGSAATSRTGAESPVILPTIEALPVAMSTLCRSPSASSQPVLAPAASVVISKA